MMISSFFIKTEAQIILPAASHGLVQLTNEIRTKFEIVNQIHSIKHEYDLNYCIAIL